MKYLYKIVFLIAITACNKNKHVDQNMLESYIKNGYWKTLSFSSTNIENLNFDKIQFVTNSGVSKILTVDKQKHLILSFDLAKEEIRKVKITYFDERECDLTIDKFGAIYLLNFRKRILNIYNDDGKENKELKVDKGDKLCVITENLFLTLNTFFPPGNMEWKNSVISVYSSAGKPINSWGSLDKSPCIDALPIVGGSIIYLFGEVVFSHSSDYIIKKLTIDGEKIKTYNNKPTFYFRTDHFTGLSESEVKEWYKTTIHDCSFTLDHNFMVSYYKKVDNSKKWLFIQNNRNNTLELNIPIELNFLGIYKNKLLFHKPNSKSNEKYKAKIQLYVCELKEDIFK